MLLLSLSAAPGEVQHLAKRYNQAGSNAKAFLFANCLVSLHALSRDKTTCPPLYRSCKEHRGVPRTWGLKSQQNLLFASKEAPLKEPACFNPTGA